MSSATSPTRLRAATTRFLAAALLAGIGSLSTASANPLAALQAYLKSSNTGLQQDFGYSVAVSGDTAVVGADRENSSSSGVNSTPNDEIFHAGAAYVFVRKGATWSQQAYLKASNPGMFDNFGLSVAISGDTIVIGASGEDSNSTGVNSTPNDLGSDCGAAYVFVRSGTTWTQQAYLKTTIAGNGNLFGRAVAISGDTVAVGAYRESSSTTGVNSTPNQAAVFAGAAYIFVRSGTTWTQQAYLKAANTGEIDQFGSSIAVAGDTVVVGAPFEDGSATGVNGAYNEGAADAGAAYVFTRSGSVWSQQAYLKAGNTGADDLFGSSVAISGDTAVVGAWLEDSSSTGVNSTPNESAAYAGAAYVFTRSGGVWSQQAYLKAGNAGAQDQFGASVAISGDTILAGAFGEDSGTTGADSTPNEAAEDAGAVYLFVRSGSTWTQRAYLKAGNTKPGDAFGASVAVSGDTLMVGASREDSSSTGVNSTPNTDSTDSGAAYIFVPPFQISPWTGDATSGIGARTLWARRFGVADNATINGVTLTGTGYVVNSPEFDLAGPTLNYTIDDSNNLTGLTGQGSATVAKRFSYGGNPATLTFKQLTPGFTYTATLLTAGWDTTPGIRAQTFTSGSDSRVIDQNAYGDNAGMRIDYTFKADATSRTLTITPPNANYTFHLYAVALRISGVTAPKDLQIGYGFGDLGFSFTGERGAIYTLWRSDNLQTWTQIPFPFTVIGNGGPAGFPMVPVFSDKQYFRVQAE